MKKIEEIVRRSAMKFGLIVVETEIGRGGINAVLYSKTRNISIGDLENVTREVQEELTAAGLGDAYAVNLSSPGLDRILKTEGELGIFSGRMVKVSFFEEDKIVARTGMLMGVKNGHIVIKADEGKSEIDLEKVASVQLWDKIFEKGGNKK